LELLACPVDGTDLSLRDAENEGGETKTGLLTCDNGSHSYPIARFIPRFVPSDLYVQSFSMEWLMHYQTQYDTISGNKNSEESFRVKTGLRPGDLEGKAVLEGGCGSGRYMQIARKFGGEVVGLDLSFAVDGAFRTIGRDPKAHLVQGDILAPPFKPSSFDFVYSIGVLHHTEDAKQGFLSLAKLLKRRGRIAIWVYPDGGIPMKVMNEIGAVYRRAASALDLNTLYWVCERTQQTFRLPRVLAASFDPEPSKTLSQGFLHPRQLVILFFPFYSLAPDQTWRTLDMFDYLAPKYQTKHSWKEVSGWFRDAKLKDVQSLPVAVSFAGSRP
jgi:SAM-dependent methyltransferase